MARSFAAIQCVAPIGRFGVFGDGLGAGTHVELFVNAADVGVHRLHADLEHVGDFLVEIAAREQFQTSRSRPESSTVFTVGGLRFVAIKILDDFARDLAAHGRAAGVNIP